MKSILASMIGVFLFSATAFSGEVRISSNPENPVVNQAFTLTVEGSGNGRMGVFFAPSLDGSGGLQGAQLLYLGNLNNGFHQLSTLAPAILEGQTLYLQAYAKLPDGFAASSVLTVTFTDGSEALPLAVIDMPDDPASMHIAPYYTAMFSGVASQAGSAEIIRYEWNFGDGSAAEGMLAAHRFLDPGDYTVSLTVTDQQGLKNAVRTQVEIQSFSGTTYYVSSSAGDNSKDGLTPSTAWKDLTHAFAQMGGGQHQPDRLLLKRGDSWGSSGMLYAPRPSILDAYGSGDRPRIEFTEVDDGLSTGGASEWGYSVNMNSLHLVCTAGPHLTEKLIEIVADGSQVRDTVTENGGIYISGSGVEFFVLEDSESYFSQRQGLYAQWASWIALRRNQVFGAGSSNVYDHSLYYHKAEKVLIEDTLFDGAEGSENFATKINGCTDVLVKGCESRDTRNGFSVGANTGDGISDNVVFMNNISSNSGDEQQVAGFYISNVGKLDIVNNLIINNIRPNDWGLGGIHFSGTHPGARTRIFNNTFYGNDIPDIRLSSDPDHAVEIRNNVFFRAGTNNIYEGFIYSDAEGVAADLESDHNLFFWVGRGVDQDAFCLDHPNTPNRTFAEWQALGYDQNSLWVDPLFLDPAGLNFHLLPGSPGIDAGTVVPLATDRDGVLRPAGNGYDLGCFED